MLNWLFINWGFVFEHNLMWGWKELRILGFRHHWVKKVQQNETPLGSYDLPDMLDSILQSGVSVFASYYWSFKVYKLENFQYL